MKTTPKDNRGASAVEYALLVAAIAAVIVTITFALGRVVQLAFNHTCQEISAQLAADQPCTPQAPVPNPSPTDLPASG